MVKNNVVNSRNSSSLAFWVHIYAAWWGGACVVSLRFLIIY